LIAAFSFCFLLFLPNNPNFPSSQGHATISWYLLGILWSHDREVVSWGLRPMVASEEEENQVKETLLHDHLPKACLTIVTRVQHFLDSLASVTSKDKERKGYAKAIRCCIRE
jgi:hypothetical protein